MRVRAERLAWRSLSVALLLYAARVAREGPIRFDAYIDLALYGELLSLLTQGLSNRELGQRRVQARFSLDQLAGVGALIRDAYGVKCTELPGGVVVLS